MYVGIVFHDNNIDNSIFINISFNISISIFHNQTRVFFLQNIMNWKNNK